jgi:tRNA threonylcarbamoyladenosine biosynthesis protein TsaB
MHFLSLETSTKNFSLSVSKDSKVLRFKNKASAKILEDSIIPTIDKVLDSARLSLEKLDALAISLGPGSFTSLRVGLSTVKAFAMGTGKPVVGICSLDILAQGVLDKKCDEICVLIDARRGMVYSAIYDKTLKLKADYRLSSLDAVLDNVHGHTLFVGDGSELYKKEIQAAYKEHGGSCQASFAGEKLAVPDARHLAKLAFERLSKKDYDDIGTLQPIYLYAEDCQVDKNVRRN